MDTIFDARKHGIQDLRDLGGNFSAVWVGHCVVCNANVYRRREIEPDGATVEYDPDWRGIMGRNSACTLEAWEYKRTGADVLLCADCRGDQNRYNRGLSIAFAQWREIETGEAQ